MNQQGTPGWLAERAGKVTASRIADVMAKSKSGEAATRATYRAELVVERLTGAPLQNGFTNASIEWGIKHEQMARACYEAETSALALETGFVQHPRIAMSGASPDGLVGDDGLVEIKAPDSKTHINTLLADRAPSQYIPQMQWQMACTDRQWCDFVSFDPRLPADLQLFVKRVARDDEQIAAFEKEVVQFLAEVDEIVARLKNLREVPA